MTVGAFTAYSQKYKHGGLRRLIRQLRDSIADQQEDSQILDTINELMNNVTLLKSGVEKCATLVCQRANQGDGTELQNTVQALADKVLGQIVSINIGDVGIKCNIDIQGIKLGYLFCRATPK